MSNYLMTQARAAELLGVHPRTLARWRAAGRLTVTRDEMGRPYYRSEEVEALLEDRAESGE